MKYHPETIVKSFAQMTQLCIASLSTGKAPAAEQHWAVVIIFQDRYRRKQSQFKGNYQEQGNLTCE